MHSRPYYNLHLNALLTNSKLPIGLSMLYPQGTDTNHCSLNFIELRTDIKCFVPRRVTCWAEFDRERCIAYLAD